MDDTVEKLKELNTGCAYKVEQGEYDDVDACLEDSIDNMEDGEIEGDEVVLTKKGQDNRDLGAKLFAVEDKV